MFWRNVLREATMKMWLSAAGCISCSNYATLHVCLYVCLYTHVCRVKANGTCSASSSFIIRHLSACNNRSTKLTFISVCMQLNQIVDAATTANCRAIYRNYSKITRKFALRGTAGIPSPKIFTFWSLHKINQTIMVENSTHVRTDPHRSYVSRPKAVATRQ